MKKGVCIEGLKDDELEFIAKYRTLNQEGKNEIRKFVKYMAQCPEMRNHIQVTAVSDSLISVEPVPKGGKNE